MEEKYSDLLKKHSLRVTAQRLEILSVIGSYSSAIPFSKIQNALTGFDRVTLYRNMLSLEEKGIIHKIEVGEQEAFYAMCGDTCSSEDHKHQHIHFKCSECETVSCIEPKKEVQVQLEGYLISQVNVSVNGVCVECFSS